MIDHSELKRLAEAASRPGLRWMTDFTLATGPATILALIAENERLGLKADSLEFAKWSCQVNQAAIRLAGHETIEDLQAERDQLKAENEALITALNEILRVTPMGVEAFGIAALVLGELGVSKEPKA